MTIGVMARKFRTEQLKEPRARVVLPDPFYYLSNFETVVASLNERYADLWSGEEQQFLAAYKGLPKPSRALLVRMVMREGVLFRANRLKYPEIGETAAAVAPLVKVGWVDDEPKLDVGELQRLITKEELLQYFTWSRPYRNLTKPDLVAMLRGQCPESRSFQAWCRDSGDRVYRLLVAPVCERFRLMFFGNFHQDWSEFVLADLGIFAYETILPTAQSRPFRCRAEIEVFERLHRCRELLEAKAAPDVVHANLPPAPECDWLEERRQKTLFDIARAYEREGSRSSALAAYSACTLGSARVRAIRLHERARRWETARALCLTAQETPADEAQAQQLRRLLPRLNRRLGLPGHPAPRAASIPSFELLLEAPSAGCAVEYQVRDFLARQMPESAAIQYVENGLINSLFGLLCWRAIFAPVAGAFFHDFHRGPADLSSTRFYRCREREFSECLAQLESGEYRTAIRETYEQKAGLQSPFVAWGLLKPALLECALSCFPAAHLRLWFDWIARDVRTNRAGFPDLVQFWPQQRRYRLIEVKGPGDRIQDNQRRLLEYCVHHQMPVSVCHVQWANQ